MPPNSKSRLTRPERTRNAIALAIEIRTYSGLVRATGPAAGDSGSWRATISLPLSSARGGDAGPPSRAGVPDRGALAGLAAGVTHGGDDPFGRNAECVGDSRTCDHGGNHFAVQAPAAQAGLHRDNRRRQLVEVPGHQTG